MTGVKGKVSIVIPAYNAEKYIEKSITSALKQTYKNVEVIVIDDGSFDSTAAIVKHIAQKFPDTVEYFFQENQGAGVARNHGITMATGDYITFLDSDDYFDFDYVQQCVNAAAENNADVVCTGYRVENSEGQLLQKVSQRRGTEWAPYVVTATAAKLYNLDFVRSKNICFLPMSMFEDACFSLLAVGLAGKVEIVPSYGYCIVETKGSTSRSFLQSPNLDIYQDALSETVHSLERHGIADNVLIRHHLIRSVAWMLFQLSRQNSPNFPSQELRLRQQLDMLLPKWELDPLARISRPKGDFLSARVATWLFVRHPVLWRTLIRIKYIGDK